MKTVKKFILCILITFSGTVLFSQKIDNEPFRPIADTLQIRLKKSAFVTGRIRVDSVFTSKSDIILYFSNSLSEFSFRRESVEQIYSLVKSMLPGEHKGLNLRIVSNNNAIEDFIPPYYKGAPDSRSARARRQILRDMEKSGNLVINNSLPYRVTHGLNNRHIALWQSHGLYFEQRQFRWEWQRPRLFQTVEDLYTQSYVLPFLVPMLENAGANVLIPRERDTQLKEIISDNDVSYSGYSEINGKELWYNSAIAGFSNPKEVYLTGENPFEMGTCRIVKSVRRGEESYAVWSPQIEESGEYAVYISYQTHPNSTSQALYTVKHSGGETKFTVNQKMGGGTWVYLGTFHFFGGPGREYSVTLSNNTGKNGEIVSADGVKLGGGMGNIARSPSEEGIVLNRPSSSTEPLVTVKLPIEIKPFISGYPRFTEGSRYWLQWAGFNDTIYSPNNNQNDYNDDYMSRGRWVNVISGGSPVNPNEKGLNIPVDLAFAFHTDAGVTRTDSVIGTLGIYTRFSNGSDIFPNGRPRFDSRFMTDLIQTQIVDDIRALYDPIWQRRGIWDRSYSESRTPNVPTMLLELLSHQNFADMRYGLDPWFRFNVSRAIYKGMLKFLSQQYAIPYVVQPLPVNSFSALMQESTVWLKWKGVEDSIEPTASPTGYIVYTRVDGGGFDNGVVVNEESYSVEIESGKIYSFKIAAVNDGGESFPSEILSVYKAPQEKGKALIINAFDRVSAPASFSTPDTTMAGFFDTHDYGVPYKSDISYIGSQYDFRRRVPWVSNDNPGFGASYADFEDKEIAGNTFDYPYVHGKAFAANGYSFVSVSRDALSDELLNYGEYKIVDVIAGKQLKSKVARGFNGYKYSLFTKELRESLERFAENGKNILISGAHIGTDIWESEVADTLNQKFAQNILKYRLRTNKASRTGKVKATPTPFNFTGNYTFHTTPNRVVYSAESPDGIEPVGEGAWTIFRYQENNVSAGVAYKGAYKTVSLGFPVETLGCDESILSIISAIIEFFE